MTQTAHRAIRSVAVVGTGVIGSGWATHFLAHGLDVVATDPAPGAEERLRADVVVHWRSLERLGVTPQRSPEDLRFVADLAEAVTRVDFVQENGPETDEVKQALFRTLDAATDSHVILASSSSGMLPSTIARSCPAHPERVLVGHPFNPAHVMPLVEVVPGELTTPDVVDRAMAFYTAIGKRPIRVQQEVPGHVANRLQAALWQEAYSLVERGVVSVADLDTAISYGPGLRWAILGPLVNQHLSGGPGGLAHILEHLGPSTERWWRDLRSVTLTPELAKTLIDGLDAELANRDEAALIEARDTVLGLLLAAKAARPELP